MYYQRILEKIFTIVDTSKLPNIPKLLEMSKGKEEAMLAKISAKYPGQFNLSEIRKAVEAELSQPVHVGLNPHPKKKILKPIMLSLLGIAILAGSYFAYQFWGTMTHKDYPSLYVIADKLTVRKAPAMGKAAVVDSEFKLYKEEIPIYETIENEDGKWAKTTHKLDTVFLDYRFLGTYREMTEADAIYGNVEASSLVENSFERRGVREYLNANGLIGNLTEEDQVKFYGEAGKKEVWELDGLSENSDFNIYASGKFSGTHFGTYPTKYPKRPSDFAVILSKKDNPKNTRKLLFFSVDKNSKPNNYEVFDLKGYQNYYIKSVFPKDELLRQFGFLDRLKVQEDKPGIVLAINGTDSPMFLITIEKGKIVVSEQSPRNNFFF